MGIRFQFQCSTGIHPFLTIHSIGGKNAKRFTTGTNDNLPKPNHPDHGCTRQAA